MSADHTFTVVATPVTNTFVAPPSPSASPAAVPKYIHGKSEPLVAPYPLADRMLDSVVAPVFVIAMNAVEWSIDRVGDCRDLAFGVPSVNTNAYDFDFSPITPDDTWLGRVAETGDNFMTFFRGIRWLVDLATLLHGGLWWGILGRWVGRVGCKSDV